MKLTKMKVTDLKIPESNIRIHTEQQIVEYARSIKMFGQLRPVVIDETNTILAGNGLVIALKKAGIDEADVYKIDDLSENQKKKLMIADNKVFNLGIDNLDTLNQFLSDLGNDLDVPGFDEDILRTMVADAEDVTAKVCEYGSLDEQQIQGIRNRTEEPGEAEEQDETSTELTVNDDESKTNGDDDKDFVICPKCGERIWL